MDGSHEPAPGPVCPRCGAALHDDDDALDCAGCWFSLMSGPGGRVVGNYRLLGEIGQGGSAVVHLAERIGRGDLFALKLARPEAQHAGLAFQNELNNARRLEGCDAGVVGVVDHGRSDDGEDFLVLQLMEGGSLMDAVAAGRYADGRSGLALVGRLASMLASAHARAVLHCDLKPDNILFDAKGGPHLADFGVGQPLAGPGSSKAMALGGTRGWMSPEQARGLSTNSSPPSDGSPAALTVASDVFSLGVILHWLVTREPPFGTGPDYEQRVQYLEPPPCIAPRGLSRELEGECASICRQALQKDPARRYQTAAQLAEEVSRALAGRPLLSESTRPLRRLALWVSRHKLLALAGVELSLLLLYLPLVPFLVLGQSRAVLEEQNANAALHQAGAVMNELRDFADRLMTMAKQPEVQALAASEALYVPSPELGRFATADIDNLIVFSTDGFARARWPVLRVRPRTDDFSFRDYFQGAAGLAREGLRELYVSRVIRSQTTGHLDLELVTPMFDVNGKWIGVAAGARPARSTFGAVQMNCAGGGACLTGLLAARDRDDAGAPQPPGISFIAAPELRTGQEVALDIALSRKICQRIGCTPAPRAQFTARANVRPLVEDFIDPVSGRALLGAFAPVGRTGLVVVVATPTSAVRELTDRMLERARSYLGVPLALGAVLFAGLLASLRLRGARLTAGG
ncbi:MAG: prkC 1 [Polyangiaceae bacterium]|nr:prkC 1 [Polyangiaceae bacterium]